MTYSPLRGGFGENIGSKSIYRDFIVMPVFDVPSVNCKLSNVDKPVCFLRQLVSGAYV